MMAAATIVEPGVRDNMRIILTVCPTFRRKTNRDRAPDIAESLRKDQIPV